MYLFVYGTLRPEAATPMARWLSRRTVENAPASVSGRLIAIEDAGSWYPALVRGTGPARCRGTVLRLKRRSDLAVIDRYEGREYRRILLRAHLDHGGTISVMAYLWRAAKPRRASVVAGGDFLAWLERTGHRAFGAPVTIDHARRACHPARP